MTESPPPGLLLDYSQDKIAVLDGSGRFTYANGAVGRLLGWESAELLGESAFDYVHPEDEEAVRAAFAETIESEGFVDTTVEYRFLSADGDYVWLESRMSNLTDDEIDGYVVSSRDIEDRVAAEADRDATAKRLEEVAAATSDVLWLFDGDWSELLFLNPAYDDLYGLPAETVEADAAAFLDAVHPDDVPAVREGMERLAEGESVDLEYRVNPGRDYEVWVWVQGEPIVEDGEVVRIAGFSRDITDRRRRERQLYVMDNLLRHNLRNDLGVIFGNAELIEQQAPETADRTAIIRQTGERLLASAEKERQIIDLVTDDPAPAPVDLRAVVEEAVASARDRHPGSRLSVTCPDDVACRALDELGAAVFELVENAVTHSPSAEPTVDVTVTADDETVTIVVADEATPIPEMEARVLTGDHRMDGVYHSSGLGLWLVYWVVELSGGTVTIDAGSDDDRGNRIVVTLSRA